MTAPFPGMPPDARLWVHAADRALTPAERQAAIDRAVEFLAEWTSHRTSVKGAVQVVEDRFLMLAAHGDLSGCGIDKSVHAVEALAEELGFRWLPALDVLWRGADGSIRSGSRAAFREAVGTGSVHHATPVFDLAITSVADLRAGRFERAAGATWHARVFRIPSG